VVESVKVGSFTLNVKVRRAGGSMIVVFNYVDTLHFYYVYLSKDPGTQVAVHNGIFIVDGGPRRRIAGLDASPSLPEPSWHDVRIVRDLRSGSIKVFLDQQITPRFSVIDRTFSYGQIGLGSFDETGDFAISGWTQMTHSIPPVGGSKFGQLESPRFRCLVGRPKESFLIQENGNPVWAERLAGVEVRNHVN
jgi:hypothetical protein